MTDSETWIKATSAAGVFTVLCHQRMVTRALITVAIPLMVTAFLLPLPWWTPVYVLPLFGYLLFRYFEELVALKHYAPMLQDFQNKLKQEASEGLRGPLERSMFYTEKVATINTIVTAWTVANFAFGEEAVTKGRGLS